MTKKTLLENIKYWMFIAIAVISGGASIAHIFGALKPWEEVVKDYAPFITLILISIVIIDLVLEQAAKLEQMEEAIHDEANNTIKSLNGVRTHLLNDREDFYKYIAKKVAQASRTICDISLGGTVQPALNSSEKDAFKNYRTAIADACNSQHIVYREVLSFPKNQFKTGENRFKRVKELIDQDLDGYQAGYYNTPHKDEDDKNDKNKYAPPFLQFMIIDNKELIFGHYKPLGKESFLVIEHPDIVNLFSDYYEALWNDSIKIKLPDYTNKDELEKIKEQLGIDKS